MDVISEKGQSILKNVAFTLKHTFYVACKGYQPAKTLPGCAETNFWTLWWELSRPSVVCCERQKVVLVKHHLMIQCAMWTC